MNAGESIIMYTMRIKTTTHLLLCLILVLLLNAEPSPPPYLQLDTSKAQEMPSLCLESELDFLLSCQMPNGAIAQSPDQQLVIPYFANLAAQVLIPHNPGLVKSYMQWYLTNLNLPDRWGLEGTIYDFTVVNGELIPSYDYDSADSYAATFLSLVYQYATETGNWDFLFHHRESLDMIAQVIIVLQDDDGLVWAKPNHRVKYLMDNAENYRGLTDWAQALSKMGEGEEAARMLARSQAVREGMQRLWDESSGNYAWGYSRWGLRRVRPTRWYPDGVAQLYPFLNGMTGPDDEQPLLAYHNLNVQFPNWGAGQVPDAFPWAMVAYSALRLGDEEMAQEFLAQVAENFARRDRPYPWYILESAYTIKILKSLTQEGRGRQGKRRAVFIPNTTLSLFNMKTGRAMALLLSFLGPNYTSLRCSSKNSSMSPSILRTPEPLWT